MDRFLSQLDSFGDDGECAAGAAPDPSPEVESIRIPVIDPIEDLRLWIRRKRDDFQKMGGRGVPLETSARVRHGILLSCADRLIRLVDPIARKMVTDFVLECIRSPEEMPQEVRMRFRDAVRRPDDIRLRRRLCLDKAEHLGVRLQKVGTDVHIHPDRRRQVEDSILHQLAELLFGEDDLDIRESVILIVEEGCGDGLRPGVLLHFREVWRHGDDPAFPLGYALGENLSSCRPVRDNVVLASEVNRLRRQRLLGPGVELDSQLARLVGDGWTIVAQNDNEVKLSKGERVMTHRRPTQKKHRGGGK